MTFLRDFFYESFFSKGGKSGAPKLPKMFVSVNEVYSRSRF